ncbi:MAG: hypothetical protein GY913_09815 [Proteobacteria bacterium]|nr:hypothetical protein [Pseudomonadota bacterium]MCP4917208.1 hypothetical protein [Pseudomonadota bacterium]
MILALLGSASATTWLADAYVELPWAVPVHGKVFASQGQADAFRILLQLECEDVERARVCVVEDAAFQARAVEYDRGVIDDELKELRDGILGATLTLTFNAEGGLRATPDLDDDDLNNAQRELAEALIGRAMVGFDLRLDGPDTWIQDENYVGHIPGANGGTSMSARHTRDEARIQSQGQGTTRTPGGSPFRLQFGAEANVDDEGLVDRWWWAVALPGPSSAAAANYVQGGLIYRIDDDATPLVGIGSGELDMTGPSLDAAVLGIGAYDRVADLDVRKTYDEHSLWVRAQGGFERRPVHSEIGTGELLAGYSTPYGIRFGAGVRAHTPREHTLLYEPHPVAARDAVVGFWYRPVDEVFAPHLGMSWLASFRTYEDATPDRIWMPAMAVDIGADFDLGHIQVGAFGRGQLDMAPTIAEHGPAKRTFQTAALSGGLQLTWKAMTW